MPIFDFACEGATAHRFEAFLHNREQADPACRECGAPTRRLISRFAAIWTKSLSDYGDPGKETYHADQKRGGHWAYRKRSEGGTLDKPIPVFLETPQDQKDFCRAEGIINPSECGQMEIHPDGQHYSSQGLPGSWV